jgi:hypothetical protein
VLDGIDHGVGNGGRRETVVDGPPVVADDRRGASVRLRPLTDSGGPVAVDIEDGGVHPSRAHDAHADRQPDHLHRVMEVLADRDDGVWWTARDMRTGSGVVAPSTPGTTAGNVEAVTRFRTATPPPPAS